LDLEKSKKNHSADSKRELERLFESTFLGEDSKSSENPQKSRPNSYQKGGFLGATFGPKKNISGPTAKKKPKKRTSEGRKKPPLRASYENEVQRIQSEIGDLEVIRQKLALSQRQMCLLLMVDPSAWSRWVKGKTKTPPHIWRALEWYVLLIEKHPEYTSKLWTFKHPQAVLSTHEKNNLKRNILAELAHAPKGTSLSSKPDSEPDKRPGSVGAQRSPSVLLSRKSFFALIAGLGLGMFALGAILF